jgi:ketosteroid isomerase-like protein
MSAAENKEVIRNMWDFSKGNAEGFLNALAENVRYTIIGTTKFSGTFNGKQELLEQAFVPLMSELETQGPMETDNLIAEVTTSCSRGGESGERRNPASRTTTHTASFTSSPMAKSSR